MNTLKNFFEALDTPGGKIIILLVLFTATAIMGGLHINNAERLSDQAFAGILTALVFQAKKTDSGNNP